MVRFLLFASVLCMNVLLPLAWEEFLLSASLRFFPSLSSGQLLGPRPRGQRHPPERPREPRLRADGGLPLQAGLLPAGLIRLDLHSQWPVGPLPPQVLGYVRVMWGSGATGSGQNISSTDVLVSFHPGVK